MPFDASAPRGGWRSETLALLASLAFTLTCNGPFWREGLAGRDLAAPATWAFVLAVGVAITAAQAALLVLLLNRYSAKPVLALLVLATASATYYMQRYGVYLDTSMLRNVLRTDVKEARELFSWAMLPHGLLYAALPLALLWRVRLRPRPLLRGLLAKLLWAGVGLAVAVGALLTVFQDFSSLMRNRKELRFLITPGNYLWALSNVLVEDARGAARPRQPIGQDAARGPLGSSTARKPVLLLLVVGETARAANWGLNGYARATTPQLAALPDVISFTQASSCGTNTEVSLPCMFSPWGRRQYDEARIRGSQSLLHVLKHAGVDVLWRDNQSGCKGVCEGLPSVTMADARLPGLCDGERCLDEVLLHDFPGLLPAQGDRVVVLHQLGNHGPAYFRRYPPAFERFKPACQTPELRQCSRQDIVNAYDNALLYTDHVLARAIALLRQSEKTHDTALLYLSDHGESLGEANLYLHGVPWAIAPKVQTEVPMLLWLSPGFAQRFRLDPGCLRQRAGQPVSHDHLFHTVLGLLDVSTSLREPTLDLAGLCRR
ncbi:putative membrane-associated, metal-dependent hydrolase [Burkholderiales bacterium JOSHI_001]|nr:putative membrane-associated, metal-dependent hydrolase [Burkholderiales bacterium JOSHI_001]